MEVSALAQTTKQHSPLIVVGVGPGSPSHPGLIMDSSIQSRDLLCRIGSPVDEVIGRTPQDCSFKVCKPLHVLNGNPVVNPCLLIRRSVGRNLDDRDGEVR